MKRNTKFPLKPFTFRCPGCNCEIEAAYRGTIHQFKLRIPGIGLNGSAGSEIVNPKRQFRPKYKAMLEASSVGDSWHIPANRFEWFKHASGPWWRRNPTVFLKDERQPDGSWIFTRTK